jgi:hypothetical protein
VDQLVFEQLVREHFPKLGESALLHVHCTYALQLMHIVASTFMLIECCGWALNDMAVTHLDNLGVQVAWVCGPWFLSIFVNVLPWESGVCSTYS